MKSLRARVKASLGSHSVAAITMLMSSSLGQATPDENPVPVSEPSILALLGAGMVVMAILHCRRK